MFQHYKRPLAVITLLALTACGGGTSGNAFSGPAPVIPGPSGAAIPPQSGAAILNTIVGVGDSLTAGTQSGVTMGEPGADARVPGGVTPPTQENGFYSLLYQLAKGVSAASMYNPATSPLPLIHQPGVGSQILFNASGPVFAVSGNVSCDAFNAAAFSLGTALSTVRISAAQTTYDLGVPGITAHEANNMTGPFSGPPPGPATGPNGPYCPGYPSNALDPTAGGLQSVAQSENSNFYPVLGAFETNGPTTMVNAAASLHPTLATVWLGANDMLKFIFSGGTAPISDSPSQMGADIAQTITTLQHAGARVVVANLPTVLSTAQFFQGGIPANPAVPSQSVFYYLQALSGGQITPAQAAAIVGPTGPLAVKYKVSNGGYLTETGFFTLLGELVHGVPPASINLDLNADGTPATTPVGFGQAYLPDAFVSAKITPLNAAYNTAIAAAAAGTGATLVDVNAAFAAISSGTLLPGQPAGTSLRFGKGLLSFDGLHPSNTGYALITNLFVQALDTPVASGGLGLAVPPLSNAQINAIYASDPYKLPIP
jgi:lysophospholipase L1-like esterase